jgi:membrane protease YdiL (CAAX protease family)
LACSRPAWHAASNVAASFQAGAPPPAAEAAGASGDAVFPAHAESNIEMNTEYHARARIGPVFSRARHPLASRKVVIIAPVHEGLGWNPGDGDVVLILLSATAAYVAFHYGANAALLARRFGLDQARAVHLQRAGGFVLLGAVPAAVAALFLPDGLADLGLRTGDLPRSALAAAGISTFALPFVAGASRQPASWEAYPQIRAPVWTRELHLGNAASWALYLLGYEFLFRGFLLMSLARLYGPWPAIAIVTAIYTAVHVTKPAGETIGTIPMGVLFGAAALYSGAIWAPFVAHVFIAVTSDYLVVRARA